MTHYEIFGDFADFRARFRGFHENISFFCSNTVNSVRQVTQTCRVVAILRNSNASPPARFSVTGTFTHTEDTPLSLKRTNIDGDTHRPHPHIPLQKQVSPILAVAHETERNRDTHVTPRAYTRVGSDLMATPRPDEKLRDASGRSALLVPDDEAPAGQLGMQSGDVFTNALDLTRELGGPCVGVATIHSYSSLSADEHRMG